MGKYGTLLMLVLFIVSCLPGLSSFGSNIYEVL